MLKRVSIQNFKSLKDVTLDLQKVNLLIGPNNSGKTNFLKALEFMKEIPNGDLIESERYTYIGQSERMSHFKVSLISENTRSGKKMPGRGFLYYTVQLSGKNSEDYREFYGTSDGLYKVRIDDLSYLNTYYSYFCLSVNDDSFSGYADYEDFSSNNPEILPNTNHFMLKKKIDKASQYSEPAKLGGILDDFITDYSLSSGTFLSGRHLFSDLTIFRPNTSELIQPANFSADEESLNGDCSNIIPFLFYLNTNHKRAYQRIESDLAKCVGDLTSISTPPVKVGEQSKLGLKFFGKNDESFWAKDVSEGVLYFLALLTIINQPNPPKLLLLEEPEKGIHPRRIFEVVQFIFRLAEEKGVQVIMTTHSPIVVDMFKDMPESVFIFDKDEEGATHVKNLQRDVIEPEIVRSSELGIEPPHYTDSLGDAWTVGFLGGVPK